MFMSIDFLKNNVHLSVQVTFCRFQEAVEQCYANMGYSELLDNKTTQFFPQLSQTIDKKINF